MEAMRHISESARNTSRSNSLIKSTPNKRSIIIDVEKNNGAKASSLKKVLYGKKENRRYPGPATFLFGDGEGHSSSQAMGLGSCHPPARGEIPSFCS